MTVQDWLKSAIADAERRGLPALKPLLEAIAKSTEALREADAAGPADQKRMIAETAPRIASGEVSPVDLVRSCLEADRSTLGAERIHHRPGRHALWPTLKRR